MTQEKKFFAPVLRTYNNNLNKRWRVEWTVPAPGGRGKRCPKPVYVSGATIEDRIKNADSVIKTLFIDLPVEKNILEKVIDTGSLSWRKKTVSAYTTVSDVFKEYLGKKSNPDKATTESIDAFLLHLKAKNTNNNTIAKYRNTLFTLYGKAVKAGLCLINPVIKVPGIKRRPKSLHFFSDAQIEAILNYGLHEQLYLASCLLFYCFIRNTEQEGLKICDINFEYGFIEVPGEISKNKKTEKVSIPTHFLAQLEYLKQYPNNYYVLSKAGRPGTEKISSKYLYTETKKVLNALNIRGRYSFYSWKHTGVVKAVKANINIKDIQLQLRHHSLDMVNEYLKNLGVMDSEDLRDKFPVLGGNTETMHKKNCTIPTEPHYNFCPGCGAKINKEAA